MLVGEQPQFTLMPALNKFKIVGDHYDIIKFKIHIETDGFTSKQDG